MNDNIFKQNVLYSSKIQILRAFAIIAVIVLHSLPKISYKTIIISNLFNFAVPLFLFLSGLLTTIDIPNIKNFYKKRITRVLLPYLFWGSIMYFVYTYITHTNTSGYLYSILTFKTDHIYYFLFVYMQLVLITPLLKHIYTKKLMIWSGLLMSPICAFFILCATHIFFDMLPRFYVHPFFIWFSFYFLGICISNKIIEIKINNKQIIYLYIFCILISCLEGILWYKLGIGGYRLPTTVLKFSSILTSFCILILSYKFIKNVNINIESKMSRFLISVGNCSFGIYLIHIPCHLILILLYKYIVGSSLTQHTALYIILTFIFSYLSILILSKFLNKKTKYLIGF